MCYNANMADSLELSRRFVEPAFREMVVPLHNLARGAVASLAQITKTARVGQYAPRNLIYAGIEGLPLIKEGTFGDIDSINAVTQADYIFEARQVDMTGLTDGTPLANALEESELPTVVIMNANKLGHLSMLAEMTWCIEEDADPQKPGSAFDQTVLSVVYLPRTDRHYREVMRVLNVKQPKDELTVTSLQGVATARPTSLIRPKVPKTQRHLRLIAGSSD